MFKLGDKLNKQRANNISPTALAFVGDAVYSLFVREKLVFSTDNNINELNRLTVGEVRASAQANLIKELMPLMTEEEILIFKRGRNAKKGTRAKSASVAEYNMSTGFEAVLGYLYVIGDFDRINFLLNKGLEDES